MTNPHLTKIEWGYLSGKRPRHLGCNARLPVHGIEVREPFARVHFDDGSSGFGFSRITPEQAEGLRGKDLDSLLSLESGVSARARGIEMALWDALGKRAGKPVYQLVARGSQTEEPLTVPCYDTSLYLDDLHLEDDEAGAQLIAEQARQGYERGHRAFKIKVGRGGLHMPLIEGTQRDIAVIRAVREAIDPDSPLMIDANNGYNANITKWVLAETADCNIYWMEEAFHEDRILYEHLHEWMQQENLSVLIADGEGQASPTLLDWAQDGVVDVVQYDLREYGFADWLKTARQLDAWGVKSAPHNYGSAFGDFATGHLASAIENFTFIEWDHIDLDGLDASGYVINEGRVTISDAPGFGLNIDDAIFTKSVQAEGFLVS